MTATSIISAPVNNQDVEVMKNEKNVEEIQVVDTETYVNEYFADTPILAKIAFCESTYRHFDENGKVLRGVVDNSDIGVMQINKRYHGETADRLGLDIFSLNGNLRYAKILYDDQGVTPWNASKPCWSKKNPHLAQS